MLLISLIMKGVSWLANCNERASEARQKAIQLGKDAKVTEDDLSKLIQQYQKLNSDGVFDASDREKAKSIQEQIVDLIGDEGEKLNLINGKYDDQLRKLREIAYEKALNKRAKTHKTTNENTEEKRIFGGLCRILQRTTSFPYYI